MFHFAPELDNDAHKLNHPLQNVARKGKYNQNGTHLRITPPDAANAKLPTSAGPDRYLQQQRSLGHAVISCGAGWCKNFIKIEKKFLKSLQLSSGSFNAMS